MRAVSIVQSMIFVFLTGAVGQELALTSGKGIRGELEIGMRCTEAISGNPVSCSCHEKECEHPTRHEGITFWVSADTLVNLIRCTSDNCVAELNIRIGTSEKVLTARYGKPTSKKEKGESRYLYYDGVAFWIHDGSVQEIFILPPSAR
jgi:hypothetical protein